MSALSLRREQILSGAASLLYQSQRAYVATMFEVLGRLLVAASAADPVVKEELRNFPEGYTMAFTVLGDTLALRVTKRGERLVLAPAGQKADLELVFKHIALAFALLSFQESTPVAYANDRFTSLGDVGLSMCFTRMLDRIQAVMLPDPVAALALKSLPNIPLGERLKTAVKVAGNLITDLIPRSAP